MLTVEDRERIRQAYYVEGKSMRAIERELKHSYWTIQKALAAAEPPAYEMKQPRPAPVMGPYKAMVDKLLAEEGEAPRKQRYTSGKIYRLLMAAGYDGSESGVRRYVGQQRGRMGKAEVYLPLEFGPGQDGQVDWGEAWVELAGQRQEVQVFVMRLCYSRKTFAMAFPTQRQEAFLAGHVAAFAHFGGVPRRLSYDNLSTAVRRILVGAEREEQATFVTLRSHYLFQSHFSTPGEGHEKGGVESGVGYVRRNFLVPMPKVASYAELNEHLLAACQADERRRVSRQTQTIGEMWAREQTCLRSLPERELACCISREVTLNPYGQVTFETNRYSVPADKAQKHLTLRAYPFRVEILAGTEVIASHERSYEREQDILDPLHYLSLLAERPGAFEHAKPLQQWRQQWPAQYEALFAALQRRHGQQRQAVREFIRILQLHHCHSPNLIATAVTQALAEGMPHLGGVTFCLHRLLDPTPALSPLDLSERPELQQVGAQPLSLDVYDQLLAGRQP